MKSFTKTVYLCRRNKIEEVDIFPPYSTCTHLTRIDEGILSIYELQENEVIFEVKENAIKYVSRYNADGV